MAVRLRGAYYGKVTRLFDVHLLSLRRVLHYMLFQWLGKEMPVDYNMRQE